MDKYKIGIGLTTHNRPEIFKETLQKMKQFRPEGAKIVVVDDCSDIKVKEADFRFEKQAGISTAKNKCLELLDGCDYIFLFDDDVYPKVKDWHLPYIESGIKHMQFSFSTLSSGKKNGRVMVKKDNKFTYWQEPCGCMNFYTKECIEKVGGMDPEYGLWGYEHVGHSLRIHFAGLTPYPFMDVNNSADLFYSFDQDLKTERSVSAVVRRDHLGPNSIKYHQEKREKLAHFIPFKPLNSAVLTCYLTSVKDPQRGEFYEPNIGALEKLILSCKELDAKLTVLTDCFPESNDGHVSFVRVSPVTDNPYFERWKLYRQWLMENHGIQQLFIVDATDVEMKVNPFMLMRTEALYVGDEPSQINNIWLKKHHTNPFYREFYDAKWQKQLFNAGIIGGFRFEMHMFLQIMCNSINRVGTSQQLTDMAMFNYVLYNFMGTKSIIHGRKVNTVFKAYDEENKYGSWFKHK